MDQSVDLQRWLQFWYWSGAGRLRNYELQGKLLGHRCCFISERVACFRWQRQPTTRMPRKGHGESSPSHLRRPDKGTGWCWNHQLQGTVLQQGIVLVPSPNRCCEHHDHNVQRIGHRGAPLSEWGCTRVAAGTKVWRGKTTGGIFAIEEHYCSASQR